MFITDTAIKQIKKTILNEMHHCLSISYEYDYKKFDPEDLPIFWPKIKFFLLLPFEVMTASKSGYQEEHQHYPSNGPLFMLGQVFWSLLSIPLYILFHLWPELIEPIIQIIYGLIRLATSPIFIFLQLVHYIFLGFTQCLAPYKDPEDVFLASFKYGVQIAWCDGLLSLTSGLAHLMTTFVIHPIIQIGSCTYHALLFPVFLGYAIAQACSRLDCSRTKKQEKFEFLNTNNTNLHSDSEQSYELPDEDFEKRRSAKPQAQAPLTRLRQNQQPLKGFFQACCPCLFKNNASAAKKNKNEKSIKNKNKNYHLL